MENAYIIRGGKPLNGTVTLSGSKNIALKTLIAALLFESEVVLENIPEITDVKELLHLIKLIGGSVKREGTRVTLDGRTLNNNRVDLLHGSKIRVSFMLFAPLLYRFGEAYIPNPGGCRLGARPIDRIVEGMKALGISVTYDSSTGYYHATRPKKVAGTYSFQKQSHTATELLIMLGMLGNETINLNNAALEPEIDDLIGLLNSGGAHIRRNGSSITVSRSKELIQKKPYVIAADRNEAVTYAVLGQVTKGSVTIRTIPESYIDTFIRVLKNAGGGVKQEAADSWTFFYQKNLRATQIETQPFPGFMTDWQPLWAILMTQAAGVSTIHERLFENRFSYVPELCKLGAQIEYITLPVSDPASFYHFNYDPDRTYRQAIRITGGHPLHNGVVNIADLRAGAALAIGGLSAEGETVVHGANNVERGYDRFVEKLQELGADIIRA